MDRVTGDKTGGTRVFAGLTVAVACVGMFVTVLDANVVTVALPSIGAQLAAVSRACSGSSTATR
ncbi:hypothetical protein GCM10018954_029030 [Kutzneria kofuensis]